VAGKKLVFVACQLWSVLLQTSYVNIFLFSVQQQHGGFLSFLQALLEFEVLLLLPATMTTR
jgi:hypothetical protein